MNDTAAPMTATGCLDLFAGYVVGIPLLLATEVGDAWVIQRLWNWFVLPAFGISVPRLLLVAGMLGLLKFATLNVADRSGMRAGAKTKDGEITWGTAKAAWLKLLTAGIVLGSGFVIHVCAGWWT